VRLRRGKVRGLVDVALRATLAGDDTARRSWLCSALAPPGPRLDMGPENTMLCQIFNQIWGSYGAAVRQLAY
jgi:hypothetical protein